MTPETMFQQMHQTLERMKSELDHQVWKVLEVNC
jgi:hypothetical protein